jgi:hypothetical protein
MFLDAKAGLGERRERSLRVLLIHKEIDVAGSSGPAQAPPTLSPMTRADTRARSSTSTASRRRPEEDVLADLNRFERIFFAHACALFPRTANSMRT